MAKKKEVQSFLTQWEPVIQLMLQGDQPPQDKGHRTSKSKLKNVEEIVAASVAYLHSVLNPSEQNIVDGIRVEEVIPEQDETTNVTLSFYYKWDSSYTRIMRVVEVDGVQARCLKLRK